MSTNKNPPSWAIRLLVWFCPDELQEGILGDLWEQFDQDINQTSPRIARRRFVWNVVRLFHPALLFRNHLSVPIMNTAMLKSHLLVALRNMRKHRSTALINVLGLSFAFAFLFLDFFFLKSELAYDQFHTQKDNIYRLYHTVKNVETRQVSHQSAVTAVPLAKDLKNEVPSIRYFSRVGSSSGVLQKDITSYREVISFVDTSFLKMFDFPLLKGDPQTALNQPNTIILSEEKAKKFFGDGDPLQQELSLTLNDSTINVVVTGVMDTKKNQSSIALDFLMPFDQYAILIPPQMFNSYNIGLVESYILVDPETDKSGLAPLLTKAVQLFSPPDKTVVELGIQALSSLHLEHKIVGNAHYTNPQKLYIMLAIALLVLVVAFINFITLSTSQALGRLKEMGMRRTLGAHKGQIVRQLIIESCLTTAIAGGTGMLIAYFFIPVFSTLVDAQLVFHLGLIDLCFLMALVFFIALLSGLLQAAVLVKYDAIQSLKGKITFTSQRNGLNEGLVVFQFALSIILIIGAVSIRMQLKYIQQKDLGFDQERLIEIPLGDSPNQALMAQKVTRYRTLVEKNGQILQVTASMNNTKDPWTQLTFDQEDGQKEALFFNQIDPYYLQTMGIELIAGKDFSQTTQNAASGIIVNQALVDHFGWNDPFSQQIPGKNFEGSHQIIGVVKDFHYSSLHQKIEPLILAIDPVSINSGITGLSTYVWPPNLYQLLVRIGPGDLEPILSYLEDSWKEINPGTPFEFNFVDEVLAAKYSEEKRWSKVINTASIFGISIAWLGLFSLMQLAVRKRTREIGIRKVLGASTAGIITLLSGKYSRLLVLSIFLSCPIAWVLLRKWLATFSYQAPLNPLLFLGMSLLVLAGTVGILSLQSYGVAQRNPVSAIKTA